jgi:transposase
MMGKPASGSGRLFYTGFSLEERVPAGHELRRVAGALDFSFVRREVAHLYGRNGHESVDPAVALKLMFLAFFYGARSERELARQLPMRLDWLWFCGMDLDSPIPDHSVLSKARRRWGLALFQKMFTRVLEACDAAGLVGGETAHADSTLLKANANKDGRISRRLWEQLEHGLEPEEPSRDAGGDDDRDPRGLSLTDSPQPESPARSERAALNNRLVSPVDPDAATHTRQGVGTMLGYRDHRLIDDRRGIITATHVTAADGDDGAQLPVLLDRSRAALDRGPAEVVGDSQYGTRSNYALCEELGIRPYLKKRRNKETPKVSWLELLPACCGRDRALALMGRRRSVAEGSFAEAHTRHHHRRCRWRCRWRVQVQAYLVATVQNLKKLIGAQRRKEGIAATMRAGSALHAALHLARNTRRAHNAPSLEYALNDAV